MEKYYKIANTVFSLAFFRKALKNILCIMGIIALIASAWNAYHLVVASMCLVLIFIAKKEK